MLSMTKADLLPSMILKIQFTSYRVTGLEKLVNGSVKKKKWF
jgi:hypothetical protein